MKVVYIYYTALAYTYVHTYIVNIEISVLKREKKESELFSFSSSSYHSSILLYVQIPKEKQQEVGENKKKESCKWGKSQSKWDGMQLKATSSIPTFLESQETPSGFTHFSAMHSAL